MRVVVWTGLRNATAITTPTRLPVFPIPEQKLIVFLSLGGHPCLELEAL